MKIPKTTKEIFESPAFAFWRSLIIVMIQHPWKSFVGALIQIWMMGLAMHHLQEAIRIARDFKELVHLLTFTN